MVAYGGVQTVVVLAMALHIFAYIFNHVYFSSIYFSFHNKIDKIIRYLYIMDIFKN